MSPGIPQSANYPTGDNPKATFFFHPARNNSKSTTSAMADQLAPRELRQRQKSVGTVELQGPHGVVKTVQLEELSDADRKLAAEFGYKPVFKREFGYLSTFSFAVSISGLFSTVATTFVYPLEAGGSASAVWCWLISGAGCMCIAVSRFGSAVHG